MVHRVSDGELRFNSKPKEKVKWGSLLLTGPGGSIQQALRVYHGRSRQSTDREGHGIWAHAFVGPMGGVFWGSQAKASLVNMNRKSKVLVSPEGSYLRSMKRAGMEAGKTFDH